MKAQAVEDMETLLTDMKQGWDSVRGLPDEFKALRAETALAGQHLAEVRRVVASRSQARPARAAGTVSDECARHMAAQFIACCERSGKLEALCSVSAQRDALTAFARDELALATRTALSTTDIPLPVSYSNEMRELISEFGVVRRRMSPYPIGMGTARPARMGTRPSFSSIAMSGNFPEKSPTITFASLDSHKIGGVVRLPREIDEQSIVSMGQFLARYGAVEFARAEDLWGFTADGTATYENVKGIVQIAKDNSKTVTLAATKTKPSDATLDDFRALRLKVNKAALNGRLSAYYLDSTWEARLPAFRTAAEPTVYQRLPDGSAVLDGYPIVWTA
jgi:HK97 family phage major capsid protein